MDITDTQPNGPTGVSEADAQLDNQQEAVAAGIASVLKLAETYLEETSCLLASLSAPYQVKGLETFITDIKRWIRIVSAKLQKAGFGIDGKPLGGSGAATRDGAAAAAGSRLSGTTKENLEGLLNVWAAVRRCDGGGGGGGGGGLVSLRQRFARRVNQAAVERHYRRRGRILESAPAATTRIDELLGHRCVAVDAVLDHGARLLHAAGTSERGLVSHMTHGDCWDWDEGEILDGSGSGGGGGGPDDGPGGDEVEKKPSDRTVVDVVGRLVQAARMHRHRGRTPVVHLLLPKVARGRLEQVDKFLGELRKLGRSPDGDEDVDVVIDCANDEFYTRPPPSSPDVIAALLRPEPPRLTPTVNLDVQALVSLVTDMSHSAFSAPTWFSKQKKEELQFESQDPGSGIRNWCALLGSHRLVTTADAVYYTNTLAEKLGTAKARQRLRLILQDDDDDPAASAESREEHRRRRIAGLQALADYPISEDLQLPVRVVGHDEFSCATDADMDDLVRSGRLPPAARAFWRKLYWTSRSSLLYGWAAGLTTISIDVQAERTLREEFLAARVSRREVGPDIWLGDNAALKRGMICDDLPEDEYRPASLYMQQLCFRDGGESSRYERRRGKKERNWAKKGFGVGDLCAHDEGGDALGGR